MWSSGWGGSRRRRQTPRPRRPRPRPAPQEVPVPEGEEPCQPGRPAAPEGEVGTLVRLIGGLWPGLFAEAVVMPYPYHVRLAVSQYGDQFRAELFTEDLGDTEGDLLPVRWDVP